MGRLKSDLKPGMVPVKRGRGRPPKHSYVNVGHLPAQDLTHIRPPAKRERTFYSSDEEDGEIFFLLCTWCHSQTTFTAMWEWVS